MQKVVRLVGFVLGTVVVACSGEVPKEEIASQSQRNETDGGDGGEADGGEGVDGGEGGAVEMAACPSLFARFCEEDANGTAIAREYAVYGLRHEDGSCRYWGGTEEQVLATWPWWGPSYGDPTGAAEVCANGCETPAQLDARCVP